MTAIALPAPYELPRLRLPRWAWPWERTKEDVFVEAIALVNTTSGTNDGSGTSLGATAASHTAGNLIVAVVVWSGNVNANVPTDTAGNTYVSTGQKANNGTSDHVEIFYAKNIAGNAANVVTGNWASAATFRRVMVHQYSGCDIAAPFATGEGGTVLATAAASATTTSWVTATADEVIVAGFGSSGAVNHTNIVAGTSFTKRLDDIGVDSGTEDRIVSATGTYTGSYTASSGTQTWWLAAASFKIAASASASLVSDMRRVSRNSLLRRHHEPRETVAVYMNALRPNWRPRPSGILAPSYS